jgi:hypothetical protein
VRIVRGGGAAAAAPLGAIATADGTVEEKKGEENGCWMI